MTPLRELFQILGQAVVRIAWTIAATMLVIVLASNVSLSPPWFALVGCLIVIMAVVFHAGMQSARVIRFRPGSEPADNEAR